MEFLLLNTENQEPQINRTIVSLGLCQQVMRGAIMCYTDEERVAARLSSFLGLDVDWDGDNEGIPFNEQELQWANEVIQELLRNRISKPHIYPETPNDVRLEWSKDIHKAIVTLLLNSRQAKVFHYDIQQHQAKKQSFDLSDSNNQDKLCESLKCF